MVNEREEVKEADNDGVAVAEGGDIDDEGLEDIYDEIREGRDETPNISSSNSKSSSSSSSSSRPNTRNIPTEPSKFNRREAIDSLLASAAKSTRNKKVYICLIHINMYTYEFVNTYTINLN